MAEIKHASIEINGGCNYACPMCPQATGREKEFLKKLPMDTYRNIVAQLATSSSGNNYVKGGDGSSGYESFIVFEWLCPPVA